MSGTRTPAPLPCKTSLPGLEELGRFLCAEDAWKTRSDAMHDFMLHKTTEKYTRNYYHTFVN